MPGSGSGIPNVAGLRFSMHLLPIRLSVNLTPDIMNFDILSGEPLKVNKKGKYLRHLPFGNSLDGKSAFVAA